MVAVALVRPAALALSCALVSASTAPAQVPPSSGSVEEAGYVEDPVSRSITRARTVALKKLQSAKCRRLFTEFQDLTGQPLELVLSAREETPEQHLWRMAFLDGSSAPTCRRRGVFAFTSPGSLTVFVCRRFRERASLDPVTAANILIHEELHSLGAGEAPMSGFLKAEEITARVEDLCGWR